MSESACIGTPFRATMRGMNATAILLPAAALVFWTFAVLAVLGRRRFGAARRRLVRAADFACGESANVPESVRIPNRNLANLLEMPVLFYLACIVLFVTGKVALWGVALAWAYVAARVAHSMVHLTYNNVMHRFRAFALSNAVLLALWVGIVVTLA